MRLRSLPRLRSSIARRSRCIACITTALLSLVRADAAPAESAVPALKNGSFEQDWRTGWWLYVNPASADAEAVPDRGAPGAGSKSVRIEVRRAGALQHIQFIQGGLVLHKGQRLLVRFRARSRKPDTILRIAVMHDEAPWSARGLSQTVRVQPEWREYVLSCTPNEDDAKARIDFSPGATVWLDDVRIEPAPTGRPMRPARVFTVPGGRKLGSDPANAVDGKPNTAFRTAGYPVLPAYLVLDLGKPAPVVGVSLLATDHERINKLRKFRIEGSADGTTWYVLAEGSASGPVSPSRTHTWDFGLAGYALRYVGLRIENVGNIAHIREFTVETAEADFAAASPAALPRVKDSELIQCLGPAWSEVGYRLSPSEDLPLRFRSIQPLGRPVAATCRLVFGDKDGAVVAERTVTVPPAQTAGAEQTIVVPLPENLPEGFCEVRTTIRTPDGEAAEERWTFFLDKPASVGGLPVLHVAADFDAIDPEGAGALMAGRARRAIEWTRRILPETQVAVVTSKADARESLARRVAALEHLLARGGSALFFGKVEAAFDGFLPVRIDRENPFRKPAAPIAKFATDHPAFQGLTAQDWLPVYAVHCTPKPDARVLAADAAGRPVIVEANRGKGKTVYVAAGPFAELLRRGPEAVGHEMCLRLLYALAGHADAVLRIRAVLQGSGPGAISARNTGRFGWEVLPAGLLTANVQRDLTLRLFGRKDRTVRFGLGPASVLDRKWTITCRNVNWVCKTLDVRAGGEAWQVYLPLGAPALMARGRTAGAVFALPGVSWVAVPGKGRTARILTLADKKDGPPATLPIPTENWLLLGYGKAGEDRADTPVLLILNRKVAQARFLPEDARLVIEFANLADAAAGVLHPWGIGGVPAAEIGRRRAAAALPAGIAERCRNWAHAALAVPVACDETFEFVEEKVRITDRFTWEVLPNDYGIAPLRLAPLPPLVAFAAGHGVPVHLPDRLKEFPLPTKYGPFAAVSEADTVTYDLPMPIGDHLGFVCPPGFEKVRSSLSRHFLLANEVTQHTSGGFLTWTPYVEDLRPYQRSQGRDFAASCIDLYKWLYGFSSILARPMMLDEARTALDARVERHYWRTLNFYQHKAFVRWRTEPFTGNDYLVTFIWPTQWQNGMRFFTDENESSALILYCIWSYAQYYGDWTTVRANWQFIRNLGVYLERVHDWALMASFNREQGSTAGIDMLNSEYPGLIALARMARQVGDAATARKATAMAARTAIPILTRRWFPEYVPSLAAVGAPQWADVRYCFGYRTTGWDGRTSLVHKGIKKDFSIRIGADYYDTSKGTSPEILALYREYAADPTAAYERAVEHERKPAELAPGYVHLFMRRLLGWPREQLLEWLQEADAQYLKRWWPSIHYPNCIAGIIGDASPVFVSRWAPLEYTAGSYDGSSEVVLSFQRSAGSDPVTVRCWTARHVQSVEIDGSATDQWYVDRQSGHLEITTPPGRGPVRIRIRLSPTPLGAVNPYRPPAVPIGPPAAN